MMNASAGRIGDFAAMSLSSLCLAHCLALPLVAGFLPLAGVWAEVPWLHWAFAIVAAPISLWTLTRQPAILTLAPAMIGLALLFAGAAAFPSHQTETVVTVAGGLLVAFSHLLNWRRRPHVCAASERR